MVIEPAQTIRVFYSYSQKDKELKDKLDQHLQALKRSGKITTWSDLEIQPGKDWEAEIHLQLNTADIILLLISPDFMASDYCYSVEMQQAYVRHNAGETCIIPILLRPIFLENVPIQKLQMLPSGGKSVIQWPRRDRAFEDITKGIYIVVEKLLNQKHEKQPLPDPIKKEIISQVQEEAQIMQKSEKACPSCHIMNRVESRFCKQCGWPFKYSRK